MSLDKLRSRKRLDWIRLAFILQFRGSLSLEELTWTFNEMFKNGKTNREVARIMLCYSRYGFGQLQERKIKLYNFNGQIPDLHSRTIERWIEKIESL
jgi:hypothetical protein